MKKIVRNIKRFIAREQVISTQKAIKLELKFFRNPAEHEKASAWGRYSNCESLWMDERGREYRIKTRIVKEQTYNIINKKTREVITDAWIEPFVWCFRKKDPITGLIHEQVEGFLDYELHPEYLVKNLKELSLSQEPSAVQIENEQRAYSEQDLRNAFWNGWIYRCVNNYTFPLAEKEWLENLKKSKSE